MSANTIPYKTYLDENEMPTAWYNLRADMKNKPAPLLNPGTLEPMKAEELYGVFCEELVSQELDNDTAYFEIPKEIRDSSYKQISFFDEDALSDFKLTTNDLCVG